MKKNKKNFFGQNSKSWFVYFTNQEIPQVGFFFGEKATLKESYEPSLGKLRWPAFFMTVYPTVKCGLQFKPIIYDGIKNWSKL